MGLPSPALRLGYDTATDSGSLEGLTILGSGSGTDTGLRLLDIVLSDAILVSLAILSLVVSWVKNSPWIKNLG